MHILVECNATAGYKRIAHGAYKHGWIAYEHCNPTAPNGVELSVHVRGEWGVHKVKHANVRVRTLVCSRALLRLTHKVWRNIKSRNATFTPDFCKERLQDEAWSTTNIQDARTPRDPRRAPSVTHFINPEFMLARKPIALCVVRAEDILVGWAGLVVVASLHGGAVDVIPLIRVGHASPRCLMFALLDYGVLFKSLPLRAISGCADIGSLAPGASDFCGEAHGATAGAFLRLGNLLLATTIVERPCVRGTARATMSDLRKHALTAHP